MVMVSVLLHLCAAACACTKLSAFISAPCMSNMLHEVGPLRSAAPCFAYSTAQLQHDNDDCSPSTRHISALLTTEHEDTSFGRADFLKTVTRSVFSMSGVVAVAGLTGQPPAASAFCGNPYPRWAYFTDFDETFVPFNFEGYSGELFVRTVGNIKDQTKANHNPLVIIPGGPGLPHDYLETMEGGARDNRVIVSFDPIGTGNSSALPAEVDLDSTSGLLSTTSLVAQARTAIEHLKLSTYHVLGHGTGAAAAVGIARASGRSSSGPTVPETRAEGVLSATLASPILGGTALPSDFLESLRAPYTRGGNEPPLCLETAIERSNHNTFIGSVAVLKKGSAAKDVQGPLECPVLITYGRRDVVGDEDVAKLKATLSGGAAPVETNQFRSSGHLPHLDEREEYVQLVQNFINDADSAWAVTKDKAKK